MFKEDAVETQVIIIGAGISGLTCARSLMDAGIDVAVIEKARGTGGRIASKRLKVSSNETEQSITFDLGASYFQAQGQEFSDYLSQFQSQGVAANSVSAFDSSSDQGQWLAVPRNSALTRHMSQGLPLIVSEKVSHLEYDGHAWSIYSVSQKNLPQPQINQTSEARLIARCKHLIISAPAEQAMALLPNKHEASHYLQGIKSDPVFVTTLVVDALTPEMLKKIKQAKPFEGIENIVLEHEKPERECADYHVIKIQTSSAWAQNHIDLDKAKVETLLKDKLESYLGLKLNINTSYIHRWLYAQYSKLISQTQGYLSFDDGLSICGDYFEQPVEELNTDQMQKGMQGVERAFHSGQAVAKQLLANSLVNLDIRQACS